MKVSCSLSLFPLILSACSHTPFAVTEDEAREPLTVLRTEYVTLHSPYGEEVSRRIAGSVDYQTASLKAIYGVEEELELTVRLVPVAVGNVAEWRETRAATKGHLRGYSLGGDPGRIVVYVPDIERESRFVSPRLLRHELAHDFNKRVALGEKARWISERRSD